MEKITIGDAGLYRGDCLEVFKFLPEHSVDLIWTDPPYGNSNNVNDLNSARAKVQGRAVKPIANDGLPEMKVVVEGMLLAAVGLLKADYNGVCVCCSGGGGAKGPLFAWLANRLDCQGLQFFHSVIWNKINPGLGWRYRRQHEMVMVAHTKGARILWRDPKQAAGNVMSYTAPHRRAHPNEKPLALVRKFLELHASPGDLVLDPFMGSGTTGVAALELGLKFVGVELDPEHFDVACGRIGRAADQGQLFGGLDQEKPSTKQAGLFE